MREKKFENRPVEKLMRNVKEKAGIFGKVNLSSLARCTIRMTCVRNVELFTELGGVYPSFRLDRDGLSKHFDDPKMSTRSVFHLHCIY